MMDQKKFKSLREASLYEYKTSDGTKVDVKQTTNGLFAVMINDMEVEYFRTKAAADEAAKDAIEAMESNE